MDIWFYQAVTMLGSGRPFLMSTQAHFVSDKTQTAIKMADIIKHWTQTATKRNKSAITVMDSYYLSHQSMQDLHENGTFVIATMNQG